MNEFYDIYEKYKNDIYRLALSYTNNFADAEDIVVNTFMKLYKNLNKINNEEHLKKWLIKVAINECKTLFLSSWKKKVSFFKNDEENNLKEPHKENILLDVIAKLPPTDRIIIHLFYYENYKIEEIATILKKSSSSIKTRLHRVRSSLKNIITEELNNEK